MCGFLLTIYVFVVCFFFFQGYANHRDIHTAYRRQRQMCIRDSINAEYMGNQKRQQLQKYGEIKNHLRPTQQFILKQQQQNIQQKLKHQSNNISQDFPQQKINQANNNSIKNQINSNNDITQSTSNYNNINQNNQNNSNNMNKTNDSNNGSNPNIYNPHNNQFINNKKQFIQKKSNQI
eukprot:TRINITY_DN33608_c0_g1_i1.p1 TRINITY_DN33608_c0_g1~~TRINITY_DN33608_c0_g1_i1.p1  ORF type:complete len:178 (+),score=36.29 TRINITY_DN33608_c0_g1_i1:39-572(+)